ncbi:KCNMB3 [Branchiostoma lanceolatum]|uniref:KCNMB3 protein n=1 Tax=Branchiostoma lanceolatum TaxID=7740 RepID=A0A8J9W535_BRALA|nr:KCNMB3 [Branchiostoma lanceolatum]
MRSNMRTCSTAGGRRAHGRYTCYVIVAWIMLGCCLGAMITCGVIIVKPIHETNSLAFKGTTCTTTAANLTGEDIDCKCAKHCHSEYPCLRITVSYADEDGTTYSGVLFESDKRLMHDGHRDEDIQCATAPCDRSRRDNKDQVLEFQDTYNVGKSYKCLYNPDNTEKVLLKRLFTWNDMFHSMLWSTLGFVFFSALLVYSLIKCNSERAKMCTMPVASPGAQTAQPGHFLPPPYPGGQTAYPQPPPYSVIDSKDEKGLTFN